MWENYNWWLPESLILSKPSYFMNDPRVAQMLWICFCDAEEDGKRMWAGWSIGAWASASRKGGEDGIIPQYPDPTKKEIEAFDNGDRTNASVAPKKEK